MGTLWRRLDRQWHAHASQLACGFAALALIFGFVAAVQRIELHDRHLWVAWGTVADWLAAVGTVAAFFTGVWVFWHGIRDRAETERRRQAELVTGWVREIVQEGDGDDATGYAEVGLINSSSGVAYDVRIEILCDPLIARTLHPEGALDDPQFIAHAHLPALPPGRWTAAMKLPYGGVRQWSLVVFFADQGDRHWLRGPAGELTPADVMDAPFKFYLRDYEHGHVYAVEVHKITVQRPKLRGLD